MDIHNFDIEKFLDLSGYDNETRVSRRKDKTGDFSNEFFTPYEIVKKMCEKIPDQDWSNPDKTFLEPTCGNFQFIIYIIYKRILSGIDWKTAISTCYGVELMQDNVDEGKQRIFNLLESLGIDYNYEEVRSIVDHNFVCNDFYKWNFDEWRPMTEEEILEEEKKNKKKKK